MEKLYISTPGSGKTTKLIELVADNDLALTFTKKARIVIESRLNNEKTEARTFNLCC